MTTTTSSNETNLPTREKPSTSDPIPPPPKSKTQAYYSTLPQWSDVIPIPQSDIDPSNPPLASINYTPRYTEAMSYLRAVMAANEFSSRCLALTEDLISMNPAHYTVWIYRMRILKALWHVKDKDIENSSDAKQLRNDVESELAWLNEISSTNLKNYQIYQHRHALVDLLPVSAPPSEVDLAWFRTEQTFLRQILSLDTKNYHVWSYRSWLCRRFPNPLLEDGSEVREMDAMIERDVYNNSAWTHRYFVIFGHREIELSEELQTPLKQVVGSTGFKGLNEQGRADVQREIHYAQDQIRLAPQNASPWNYMRGVMRHGGVGVTSVQSFVEEFIGKDGDVWQEHEQSDSEGQGQKQGVRSSHAVEWLSEIYALENTQPSRARSKECLKALSEKWDPIRRNYWDYKLGKLEEQWQKS